MTLKRTKRAELRKGGKWVPRKNKAVAQDVPLPATPAPPVVQAVQKEDTSVPKVDSPKKSTTKAVKPARKAAKKTSKKS